MSYQVLARKWRPRSFDQLVGQEHVMRALVNALDNNRLHHAYLFTGTRGVGKTTIARIIAKCLNCETGVTSTPCGECSACNEIAEGRFVDLIEVDAASRTKVEDTRELLENVQYAPTRGRYKVYLIDEVHMLSTHSFNALLKTLEEPPPHVKFLLATTDPQKLPVTILSRCLQFNLKNLPPERIADYLKDILGQEGIEAEQQALWSLARAADGSMRDALSLTDQAIAHGNGVLKESEVNQMLGTIDRRYALELLQHILANDGAAMMKTVAQLAEQAPDYSNALADLIGLLHKVALVQAIPGALSDLEPKVEQIRALAANTDRATIQLFYQMALLGRKDLSLAPDQRAGFEMVLMRMLAFLPDIAHYGANLPESAQGSSTSGGDEASSAKKPETRPSAGEAVGQIADQPIQAAQQNAQQVGQTEHPSPFDTSVTGEPSVPVEAPVPVTSPAPVEPPVPNEHSAQDLPNSAPRSAAAATPMPDTTATVDTAAAADSAVESKPFGVIADPPELTRAPVVQSETALSRQQQPSVENWARWFDQREVNQVQIEVLVASQLVGVVGNGYRFRLAPEHSNMYNPELDPDIAEWLSAQVGHKVTIAFEIAPTTAETPHQWLQARDAERRRKALADFKGHAGVQQLVAEFDAEIVEQTIAPTNLPPTVH